MTSDRPYRRALSIEDAAEELRANSGTQFDPNIVDAAIRVIDREYLHQKATGSADKPDDLSRRRAA
jgi:HD-GYP domain-containing protein (c-di-GMP phosphodiesterase class II)